MVEKEPGGIVRDGGIQGLVHLEPSIAVGRFRYLRDALIDCWIRIEAKVDAIRWSEGAGEKPVEIEDRIADPAPTNRAHPRGRAGFVRVAQNRRKVEQLETH